MLNKGIGGNRLLHDGNTLAGTPFEGIGPLIGDSALSHHHPRLLHPGPGGAAARLNRDHLFQGAASDRAAA